MAEVIVPDKTIHDPTVAELHPARTTPQGTQEDSVLTGHEQRDINVRAIAAWFAGLFAIVVVTHVLLTAMFFVIVAHEASRDVLPSPLAPARQVPPPPYIEGLDLGGKENAGTEMHLRKTRMREEAALNASGKDPRTGANRIPISEAMKLVEQRGLPVAPQAGQTATKPQPGQPRASSTMQGQILPLDSSGGRKVEAAR